jgi:hypothetical protein
MISGYELDTLKLQVERPAQYQATSQCAMIFPSRTMKTSATSNVTACPFPFDAECVEIVSNAVINVQVTRDRRCVQSARDRFAMSDVVRRRDDIATEIRRSMDL